ncbi:rhodanese-like domain-containing protein [Desulfomarina sp.]
MRIIKTLLISIILIFSLSAPGSAGTIQKISGQVINGLRILSESELARGSIRLYRGDYVVFPADEKEQKTLTIEGLKIHHTFPPEKGQKKYVKFKQTGHYPFQFGDIHGTVEIIEFAGTNYRPVTAEEARKIITNISPLILDVRTPGEYRRDGYIENSILLPVQVIQHEYVKLLDHKGKPILIYCATGNRSTVAAKILIDKGFKNIYNMRYGIAEWKYRGFPVVKEK